MTTDENQIEPSVEEIPPIREISLTDLPEPLRQAANRVGWTKLMPVQARSIPYLLDDKDIMVQSQTGSGKTAAFILPLLMKIDPNLAQCQALVLTPTRELALQVAREAQVLAGDMPINTVVVYGGVGYGSQMEGFKKGAHLVVGTPGRILDHLLKRTLKLDHLSFLVLDEADRMMSMGFFPDMMEVRRYVPEDAVGAMFSATYPYNVKRLASAYLHSPEFLSLSEDQVHVAETRHVFYVIPPMDKDRALARILEIENPTNAIIFCNTKSRVDYVTQVLQRFGFDADQLTSDLAQGAREKVLERVRKGNLRFLIATDVAQRGIDIPNLSHVILYEFPEDTESYIHRAGRTGRAGAPGTAVSLVNAVEKAEIGRVSKKYKIVMEERESPTEESLRPIISERSIALLEADIRTRDRMQRERMERFIEVVRTLAQNEEEIELLAMLMDDYYHAKVHESQMVPMEGFEREISPRPSSSRTGPDAGKRRRPGRTGNR